VIDVSKKNESVAGEHQCQDKDRVIPSFIHFLSPDTHVPPKRTSSSNRFKCHDDVHDLRLPNSLMATCVTVSTSLEPQVNIYKSDCLDANVSFQCLDMCHPSGKANITKGVPAFLRGIHYRVG
jgi:hypothetical protein